MARSWSVRQFATIALLASSISARPEPRVTSQSQSISSSAAAISSSPTTQAQHAFTTAIVPMFVYSMAESMMSQYFPSTTPLALSEVQWPSTLVVDSVTYNRQVASATPTQSPEGSKATPTSKPSNDKGDDSDKHLGIILGVVLGAIALAIMGVIFWCLARRRRRTGRFFVRHSVSTISSGGSQRYSAFGSTPQANSGAMAMHNNREPRLPVVQHPDYPSNNAVVTGAAASPTAARHQRSWSTSSSRPYVTPQASYELASSKRPQNETHNNLDSTQEHMAMSQRDTDARPSTPFSPDTLWQRNRAAPLQQQQQSQNPFSSPEDRESDDIVSPIMPQQNWERRRSGPMLHYPSMSEVSEFDFGDSNHRRSAADNGDNWNSSRERRDGRHELA